MAFENPFHGTQFTGGYYAIADDDNRLVGRIYEMTPDKTKPKDIVFVWMTIEPFTEKLIWSGMDESDPQQVMGWTTPQEATENFFVFFGTMRGLFGESWPGMVCETVTAKWGVPSPSTLN